MTRPGICPCLSENSLRVLPIDLLQDVIAQTKSVERPVVGELVPIIEMLVFSLKDPEGGLIHFLAAAHVGPVNEPILVLLVELRGSAGDSGGLGKPRADIGVKVGAIVKHRTEA